MYNLSLPKLSAKYGLPTTVQLRAAHEPMFTVQCLAGNWPLGCARFAEIWLKYFEFHILWSLSSVDFHTFTLQLPIQTQNSVAPDLQAFVSSLAISAKRAHPRYCTVPGYCVFVRLNSIFWDRSSLCFRSLSIQIIIIGLFWLGILINKMLMEKWPRNNIKS